MPLISDRDHTASRAEPPAEALGNIEDLHRCWDCYEPDGTPVESPPPHDCPLYASADQAAEHMLLALEVQCERDGEAHYESLTALRCRRLHPDFASGCTVLLFYEGIGDTRWLRTREQALAYIAAKKRGVPW